MNGFNELLMWLPTIIFIFIIVYSLFLAKLARDLRELGKLNMILESGLAKMESGNKDFSEEIEKLQNTKWKFHKDKVDLFIQLYGLCSEGQTK